MDLPENNNNLTELSPMKMDSANRISSEGRYAQRLRQLEDDNAILMKRVEDLLGWKQRVEDWIYEHFEVRLDAIPVPLNETNRSDRVSTLIPNGPSTSTGATINNPYIARRSTVPPAAAAKEEPVPPIQDLTLRAESSPSPPIPPKKRKTEAENATTGTGKEGHRPQNGSGVASRPNTLGASSGSTASNSNPQPWSAVKRLNGLAPQDRPGPKSKKITKAKNNIDEDARCSVCDDKYAEENNEMIFCDKCDICVHQACYGIKTIPETDWYCKPCEKGLTETPKCMFCPNSGGAMVPVRSPSHNSWAHVFCAMWIPEVSFLNPDDIDLVINVDRIEKSRWTLKCSLCKKGKGHGACIQCQWKKCITAFHVTCASKNKLKMEGVLDDTLPDGVALMAYCQKHRHMEGH